jgi:hypothetical protein
VLLVNGPSLTFGPNNLVSFNSKMVLTLAITWPQGVLGEEDI